ncbi:MAG: multiheme c-type cytochrome [Betaproteobacteria bacterium]
MSQGFKDREHLIRLAGLFAAGTLLFLVARHYFVPKDFGVYGFYRAGALTDIAAHPIAYAGQAACVECHSDVGDLRATGKHAHVSCESCHGPLAAHASGEVEKPPRPEGRAICIRCHTASPSKPKAFPQIVLSDHAGDGPCIECHKPHAPTIS